MKINIVYSEDWCGVYLENALLQQDHTPNTRLLLEQLGFEVNVCHADEEWIDKEGWFPDSFEDVELERPGIQRAFERRY